MQHSALLPGGQARCLVGSTRPRPLAPAGSLPRAIARGGRRPSLSLVAQARPATPKQQQGVTTPLGFFPSAYDNIARKEYRTVYDFESWLKHRSPWRYFMRLLLWHKSYTLKNLAPALVWVTAVSAGIGAYMTAVTGGLLPGFPSLVPNAACTAFIANTTMALSVLLVFRTNASYARWDEARKMWGGLLNRSRDLIRQTVSYLPDQQKPVKEAIGRWVLAYARLLRVHFQPEVTFDEAVGNVLRPEEIAYLRDAPHKPLRSVHVLSQYLMAADISVIQRQEMSQNLTFFQDVLGGCERLLRAPIPTSYTRHTSRFLMLWLSVLPFALFPTCGWSTIPVCAGIASVLCGIEEIGVQCEEPFGILPLSVLGDRIEDAIKDAVVQDQGVKVLVSKMLGADVQASAATNSNGNGNGTCALHGNVVAFANA